MTVFYRRWYYSDGAIIEMSGEHITAKQYRLIQQLDSGHYESHFSDDVHLVRKESWKEVISND